MNSRRWVIYLFVGLVLFYIGIRLLWHAFAVEDRLRKFILAEIKPYIHGEITIQRVSVNLNSINFHQVAINFQDAYQFQIKRLQLGFNAFNLLKYNFNPIRFVSDISMDQPVIIIKSQANSGKEAKTKSEGLDIKNITEQYKKRLAESEFIGLVIIENGAVIWQDANQQEISLLTSLRGWINTNELDRALVRMKGRLFASENDNIEMKGQGNLIVGRIDSLSLSISDENLSTTVPTLFPDFLKIESGQLSGEGVLKDSPEGRLILNGNLSITNATLNLFQNRLKLQNLGVNALVHNWDLEIQTGQLNFQNLPVSLSGKIRNLLNPEFDLSLTTEDLDVQRIVTELLDKENRYQLSGMAKAEVQIQGFARQPHILGRFSVPKVQIQDQTIYQFSTELEYQNQLLTCSQSTGRFSNLSIQNRGNISFAADKPVLDFHFQIRGNVKPLLPRWVNPELRSLPLNLQGKISGSTDALTGEADFRFFGCLANQDSIPVSGKLVLNGEALRVTLVNGNAPFSLTAEIKRVTDRFQIEGKVDHFGGSLWDLTPLPFRNQLKKLIYVSFYYTGDQSYATYSLVSHRKNYTGDSDILFQVDGNYKANGEKSNIKGDITYFPDTGEQIHGDLKLTFSPKSFTLERYRLGDFYDATAQVDFTGERRISGKFEIDKADIAYIFDGILLQPNFDLMGKISGNLEFAGSLSAPEIQGKLTLEDGIMRATGYYSGNTAFHFANQQLQIQAAELYRDNHKLLAISGNIDLAQRLLDMRANGKDVDVALILNLLIPGFNYISGVTDFNLSMSNQWKNPDINGEIQARNGKLFFVNYDTLNLSVGRKKSYFTMPFSQLTANANTTINTNDTVPGFYIRQAHLVRGKRFAMDGTGFLPFGHDYDMDMRVWGTGDAFAILFEDLPFVRSSRSESKFRWGFGGTYSNFIYTEGEVSIKNGILQLEDIAPLVENIQVEATLEPVNQFLHFTKATGTIRNGSFSATTRLDSLGLLSQLEPLVISTWGLNFGIIEARTGKQGVPVHIPGLMEKGEQGWAIIQGRDPASPFIVAGPSEHPLARGEAQIYNLTFTFPFIVDEAAAAETTLTQKILESMIWDVHLVPVKDVRYVKKIPGLIDNVWINAYIDPKISDLNFSGIVADESFRADGSVQSTRGTIEYLDLNFNVEKFAADFDRSDIFPVVYGRARTTISDSTGFPYNVYMTLYLYDKETKQELEKGRWDADVRFKLSADNPTIGTNEGQILAALGYSVNTLKSTEVIGTSTDNLLFRPLFRPVERKLERTLGLDIIRFRSRFARNVMDMNFSRPGVQIDPRYFLFRSTQLTIGKYMTNNLYFLYSGQIEAGLDPRYQEKGLGLKHSFDLEYRLFPNLLLELQYNYDSLLLLQKEDKRIQIRHSFNF